MKRIIKTLFIAILAVTAAGCTEKGPEGTKTELNQNIQFTFDEPEVDGTTVRITVNHDGAATDTWYYFCTDDLDTDDMKIIGDGVAAILAEDGSVDVYSSTRKTIKPKDLEPQTDYRFIVIGLTAEGTVYGAPASVEFTTGRGEAGEVTFTENPAWTVEYTGLGTIQGTEYEHTITVTSTDENTYFITGFQKSWLEDYGVAAIAEYELSYLMDFLDYYNSANGTSIKISDMLFQGSGIDALSLIPGDWYAMAIGVDTDGNLTGLYALSEVITIKEEEPTEAYQAWIGDYTWTGANGVSFDVTFEKGINNLYYYMSGWEGNSSSDLKIQVDWSEEVAGWAIYTQYFGTFDFGDNTLGDVYFVGASGNNVYPVDGLPICYTDVDENGNTVVVGYSDTIENQEVNIEYMMYLAAIEESLYAISETEVWPTFPATLTKKASAQTLSEKKTEMKSISKFANMPKALKLYYPTDKKIR